MLMVGALIEVDYQLVLSTCVTDSAKPALQWPQVHFPCVAPGCLQESDSGPQLAREQVTGRLPSCGWAGPRGSVLLSMSLRKVLWSGDGVCLASFGLTHLALGAAPEGMAPEEQLPLKLSKWGHRRETLQSGHFLSLQLFAEEEISPRGFVWSACVRSHSLSGSFRVCLPGS